MKFLFAFTVIMLLNGIIAITNCNGDSASLWKTPFWIFILVKLFPPAVRFKSPMFHGIFDEFYNFAGYPVHFKTVYYAAL